MTEVLDTQILKKSLCNSIQKAQAHWSSLRTTHNQYELRKCFCALLDGRHRIAPAVL